MSVEVVPLDAARIVTLRDPPSIEGAAGAFVRLEPPEDHPPQETAAWRARAAEVAAAVMVLPSRKTAGVPVAEERPAPDRGADVRAEALDIARERGGEELVAVVDRLFDAGRA